MSELLKNQILNMSQQEQDALSVFLSSFRQCPDLSSAENKFLSMLRMMDKDNQKYILGYMCGVLKYHGQISIDETINLTEKD